MIIKQNHFKILKEYLDRKINPEDIAPEDRIIIFELCKARKKQIQKKLNMKKKKINELNIKYKKE